MVTIILCSYMLLGLIVGGWILIWQYFYSSSGEVRGDDLLVALIFTVFWPVVLAGLIVIQIGKFFSHSRVIVRRKK